MLFVIFLSLIYYSESSIHGIDNDKKSINDIIKEEELKDEEYPEHVRKKRQASRLNFQQYLANMGKVDYDVRYEEG